MNDFGSRYGPAALWFLNRELDESELRWQVREMAEKGIVGFFMHSLAGNTVPYLSETWFQKCGVCIDEADRQDVLAWLYDEDWCPSGFAGGHVMMRHPELQARALEIVRADVSHGAEARIEIPAERVIAAGAYRVRRGRIELDSKIDLSETIGVVRHDWDTYWHTRGYYPGVPPVGHWRGFTKRPAMTLAWTPPRGNWRVFVFLDVGLFQARGLNYIDVLNPESARAFIEATHEEYRKRFGELFGGRIPGIFTDEPKMVPHGDFAWSGALPAEFAKRYGYDLVPLLPALVEDVGPITTKVRCDYRRLLMELFAENFCGALRRWCEKHGLVLTGHISPEENPLGQVKYLSDLMPLLKEFHVPGCDLIIPRVGDYGHRGLNLGPKLVSSVAHQQGRPIVMEEAFACSGWEATLEDLKWLTDWLYVLGVNFLVIHGLHYSIDGARKKAAPPSQFYQATYWPYFRHFADYVAMLDKALRGAKPRRRIGLLYPMTSLWSVVGADSEKAEQINRDFVEVVTTLLQAQRDHDFVDEADTPPAKVEGRTLCIGEAKYEAIVLPPLATIHLATLEVLEKFVRAGGLLMLLGGTPEHSAENGEDPDVAKRLRRLLNAKKLRAFAIPMTQGWRERLANALDKELPREFRLSGAGGENVITLHVDRDRAERLFLMNTSRRRLRLNMEFAEARSWQAIHGELARQDDRRYSLVLEPRGSLLMEAQQKALATPRAESRSRRWRKLALPQSWQFSPESDNGLVLANWKLRWGTARAVEVLPGPLHRQVDLPGEFEEGEFVRSPRELAMPAGRARYSTEFQAQSVPDRLLLVLEESSVVGSEVRITLNGKRVGPLQKRRVYDVANRVADVQNLVRKGRNRLEVEAMLERKDAGLLEPLRLLGSFAVRATARGWSLGTMPHVTAAGDWCKEGLPHFSGTACYRCSFDWGQSLPGEARLQFPKLGDMVEVILNGRNLGLIAWHPYRIDVAEVLRRGRNDLELRVTNSIYNLLEGVPKPSGLLEAPELRWR